MRWKVLLFSMAFLASFAPRANAACPHCRCDVSVAPVSFGSYNPVEPSPTRVASTLQLACSSNWVSGEQSMSYSVALSSGKGSYAVRQMIQGNNRIAYNLYADPAHTIVWGNGTGGSVSMSGVLSIGPSGGSQTLTVHGEIPAMQPVPAGSYFDVIVATVSY